jgi:Zn-dependent protease with chaperone function
MKGPAPAYSGSAFHPAFGEGEVSGRIVIEPQRLLFLSDTANVELSLDLLNIEPHDSDRLRFSSPEETDWVVYVFGDVILKNYFFTRRNRLRLLARELRRQREGRRTLKLAGIFLVAFSSVAAAVWLLSGWTINFLVRQVPISWEIELADSAYEEIEENIKPVDDPRLKAVLRALTDRLAAVLPNNKYQFQLQIIDEPTPNAFALPGGRILVTTGLFAAADRPEEIAGVLAHEIAHVTRRHGLRQIITTAGSYYVLKVFISDERGFLSLISHGSQLLVRQSFSRELEREADEAGWHYLAAANIDPRGLADFLRKLMADRLTRKLEQSPLQFLSSHPPTTERIEHLDELWEHAKKKSGFANLHSAVPQKID